MKMNFNKTSLTRTQRLSFETAFMATVLITSEGGISVAGITQGAQEDP